jgi:hypothetical protein
MRSTSRAQSLVEMALLAPLLISIFFLIIDFGWWIYGYGTIYNATRRASEQATVTPPWPSKLNPIDLTDACVAAVVGQATDQALFYVGNEYDLRNGRIQIRYPAGTKNGVQYNANSNALRYPGGQIEVSLTGQADWLTPVPTIMGMGDSFIIRATSRRTIEGLGLDPSVASNILCEP